MAAKFWAKSAKFIYPTSIRRTGILKLKRIRISQRRWMR